MPAFVELVKNSPPDSSTKWRQAMSLRDTKNSHTPAFLCTSCDVDAFFVQHWNELHRVAARLLGHLSDDVVHDLFVNFREYVGSRRTIRAPKVFFRKAIFNYRANWWRKNGRLRFCGPDILQAIAEQTEDDETEDEWEKRVHLQSLLSHIDPSQFEEEVANRREGKMASHAGKILARLCRRLNGVPAKVVTALLQAQWSERGRAAEAEVCAKFRLKRKSLLQAIRRFAEMAWAMFQGFNV